LVGVILVGLVPNLWWLGDWVKFSWVRQATAEPLPPIPSWNHILGSFHDYQRHLGEAEISWPLMILAGLGLLAMLRGPFLRVVLYSCLVLMVLGTSRLGECWPLAKNMGLEHAGLLIPAMALIPAVDLVSKVLTGARVLPIISLCVALLPALCAWTDLAGSLSLRITPLRQGLTDGQQKLITDLQNKTQPDARILLEQTDHRGSSWNWTAYLPRLTQRAYLGGLDPDAAIEHMSCQWYRGLLAQRPLALWTDEERDDYIEKYNISWVLCRTREGVAFWNRYPGATILSTYDDGQPATLIALPRSPSFVLSGTATLERAESTRIVLTNVAPDEDGEVILSLHYQPELRAAPLVVQIEKAQDITDPVPFIKLKVPGPVSRVTLTWEHP
jgi:hypothetical protein